MSVVELLVALVLASIVLGAATVSLLRQQQGNTHGRALVDADLQLVGSLGVIGDQLSSLERPDDLVVGEVRDTAVQMRAPIASGLSCYRSSGTVTLAADSGDVPLTGMGASPKVGDSLWFRGDSSWTGSLVTSVSNASGSCAAPLTAFAPSVRLGISIPDTIGVAAPIRVTRQTRFSLYRSTDGTWQLGFREATGIPSRFAASQPVVGPLVRKIGARQSGFRYFDSTNTELPIVAGETSARDVARIRITAYALVPNGGTARDSLRADSLDIALLHARGP